MTASTELLKSLSVCRSTASLLAAQLQTLQDLYADNPSAQDAVRRWWAQADLAAELLAKREAELEKALQREDDLRAKINRENIAYWEQRTEEQAP
jgi:hypothetical protein